MCVTRNVLNQTGESVDMFVRWRLWRVQKGCCAASVCRVLCAGVVLLASSINTGCPWKKTDSNEVIVSFTGNPGMQIGV